MADYEGFVTTIDPDSGRVDLPLNLSLEWFDLLRGGVVGIVKLIPTNDGEGTWTILYEQAPAVNQAHVEAAAAEQEEEGE